ncbi:hypothetical protein BGW37DRAFT_523324 [Umbelopsis sp. PMI_123]|nr:hypothetical protein BGW37DRAFT_523324 [Umbelopsis sp. PMI_123]
MAEPKAGTPGTLLEKLVLHSPRPGSPVIKGCCRARDLTAVFQAVANEEAIDHFSNEQMDEYMHQKHDDADDFLIGRYFGDQTTTATTSVFYLHGVPLSKTFDIWEDNKDSYDCNEDNFLSDTHSTSTAKDKENMPPTSSLSLVEPLSLANKDHVCSTNRSHLMELQLRNFVNEVEALWRRSLHTKTKTTNFGKRGGRRNRVIEMAAKANSRYRLPKNRNHHRVNILFPLDDSRYLYSRYK